MKKIVLLLSLFIIFSAQAENQTETKISSKNKLYKEHKKQLMEQNKFYQEEKRKKGIITDADQLSNNDIVDFSTGRPVKK